MNVINRMLNEANEEHAAMWAVAQNDLNRIIGDRVVRGVNNPLMCVLVPVRAHEANLYANQLYRN